MCRVVGVDRARPFPAIFWMTVLMHQPDDYYTQVLELYTPKYTEMHTTMRKWTSDQTALLE